METDKIKNYYNKLIISLRELIEIEKIKTFSDIQLAERIDNLHKFSLECPCTLFEYDIEKDNCLFYSCKDLEPLCKEDCGTCKVDCEYCERTSHWAYIRYFSKELDKFHYTGIWNLYICLYLANELKQIEKLKTHPKEELFIEVSDFRFVKDKFKE